MTCFNSFVQVPLYLQVPLQFLTSLFTVQVPLYHEIIECQVLSTEDCRKAVWVEELSGMFLSLPDFSQSHSSSLLNCHA